MQYSWNSVIPKGNFLPRLLAKLNMTPSWLENFSDSQYLPGSNAVKGSPPIGKAASRAAFFFTSYGIVSVSGIFRVHG